MADLARIKRNVAKMVSMNAPMEDIDGYIASEGVTIEDVRNFKMPSEQQNKPIQVQKPVEKDKSFIDSFKSMVEERGKQIESEWQEGQKAGAYYGGKVASALSLGGSDWARKKYGNIDVEGKYQKYEQEYPPAKNIGTVVELGSMFLPVAPANLAFKGVSAGVKAIPETMKTAQKIAKYTYIPATGMAEGTASGYFATDSGKGALFGGVLGGVSSGAFGAVGGLAKQGFSAAKRVRNIDTGLENAILSPKGRGLIAAGIDSNKSIAQTVKDQIPNVLEGINKKADDAVRSIFGSFDVPANTAQAKLRFKNYMQENANNQGINIIKTKKGKIPNDLSKAFGLKDLSITQRKKLNQAGAEAYSNLAKSAKDKEIIGRLGFLQETEAILTDMADAAKKTEGALSPVKKATRESLQIDAVKEKLLDKIAEQGDETLQLARKDYKTAMKIQNAFDEGKKHTAESIKDYSLKTPQEKDAFLMGTLYKAEVNPTKNVAQRILDNLSVLRDVDPKKARQVEPLLRKLSLSYSEGAKLGNRAIANTERRLKDFNIPTTSVLLNKGRDVITGRKYRKAVKHILNPQKHPLAEPNLMPYYNFGQQGANALIRELANEEVK